MTPKSPKSSAMPSCSSSPGSLAASGTADTGRSAARSDAGSVTGAKTSGAAAEAAASASASNGLVAGDGGAPRTASVWAAPSYPAGATPGSLRGGGVGTTSWPSLAPPAAAQARA
ncbi:hypothetical protein ACRAWC_14035 [Leifsonia sp. L25]|uniref:hypothetical protein n=1 Tax=Leifsonia sp. L25 TaxID=3423957 RepID=UPI003D68B879